MEGKREYRDGGWMRSIGMEGGREYKGWRVRGSIGMEPSWRVGVMNCR